MFILDMLRDYTIFVTPSPGGPIGDWASPQGLHQYITTLYNPFRDIIRLLVVGQTHHTWMS